MAGIATVPEVPFGRPTPAEGARKVPRCVAGGAWSPPRGPGRTGQARHDPDVTNTESSS